jgi:hypothetical protein
MRKGYRLNSVHQFAVYAHTANFGILQTGANVLGKGFQKVTDVAESAGKLGGQVFDKAADALGTNPGAALSSAGNNLVAAGNANQNALKLAAGQGLNTLGNAATAGARIAKKNKKAMGQVAAVGAGAGAGIAAGNAMRKPTDEM